MTTARNFIQQRLDLVLHCQKCGHPLRRGEDRYCKACALERQQYHGSW